MSGEQAVSLAKTWAPPDTMLGLLARGRGLGWLQATDNPKRGSDELLRCLTNDPCWDGQVESRTQYYVTLAIVLGVPAAELVPLDQPSDERLAGLLDHVGVGMAMRGDPSGLPALHAHVLASPSDRPWLLRELARIDRADALEPLRGPLLDAVDEEELTDLIRFTPEVPWGAWAVSNGRVAAALRRGASGSQRRSQAQLAADAPMEEILRAGFTTPPRALLHRFRSSLSPAEVEVIRRAAREGTDAIGRRVAFRVLSERGDPSVLDVAEAIFEANTSGGNRAAAIRYIEALPPTFTLPLAREWLDVADDRGGVAASLLALHAEPEDADAIRQALDRAWPQRLDFGWMYTVCSLVDALGRLPEHGPYSELVEVFEAVEYSYARRRAARALHQGDPKFPDVYGRECLWDCEATTRAIGVVAAPEGHPARHRLDELSQDENEDSEVRGTALARLRTIADDALDAMTAEAEDLRLYE